jgi:hypothetical protein
MEPAHEGARRQDRAGHRQDRRGELKVDEAVDYVMHRWPLGFGPNLAAQLRAAVRGTGTVE